MIASARARGFSGGTMRPVSLCATTSGSDPTAVTTTGVSQAIASAAGRPKPS